MCLIKHTLYWNVFIHLFVMYFSDKLFLWNCIEIRLEHEYDVSSVLHTE
jgi:hypothetical protein